MNGGQWPRGLDLFGEVQREFTRLLETLDPLQNWRVGRPYPAINVYDSGDRYVVTAELPGMEPESLDLSLTGELLTLQGERRRPEGVADEAYRRQERYFGRWSRVVPLPGRVEGSKVTAGFADGILTVELPKAEDARPRRITVGAAAAGHGPGAGGGGEP